MYLQIDNERQRIVELFNDQQQMLGIIYSQLMKDSGKFRIGGEVYHTTFRAEVVPIEYNYEQDRYLLAVSVRNNYSQRISTTNHTVELKLVDNFGKMELYIGQRGRVIKRKKQFASGLVAYLNEDQGVLVNTEDSDLTRIKKVYANTTCKHVCFIFSLVPITMIYGYETQGAGAALDALLVIGLISLIIYLFAHKYRRTKWKALVPELFM